MTSDNSNFYTITLIFSLIAALLVFLTDFGGWYVYDSYYQDLYYYFYLGSGITPVFYQILLVIVGLLLIAIAYFSYKGLREDLNADQLNMILYGSITAFALTIIITLLFLWYVSDSDEWWLDTGFYAALVGSSFSWFFLSRIKDGSEK